MRKYEYNKVFLTYHCVHLRILNNSKFILMAISLRTNAVVVTKLHCNNISDISKLQTNSIMADSAYRTSKIHEGNKLKNRALVHTILLWVVPAGKQRRSSAIPMLITHHGPPETTSPKTPCCRQGGNQENTYAICANLDQTPRSDGGHNQTIVWFRTVAIYTNYRCSICLWTWIIVLCIYFCIIILINCFQVNY